MITTNVQADTSSNIITKKGYKYNIPNSYTGRSTSLSNTNEFMIGGGTYFSGLWTPSLFHFKYNDVLGSSSSVTILSFPGGMSSSSRINFEIIDKLGTNVYVTASDSNVIYFGEITFLSDWTTLTNADFYTLNCIYGGTC
jgi:hypothetical protein